MSTGEGRDLRVVAIQPTLRLGEVEWNLRRCADLVTQAAREHGPDLIVLPEAMTSPNGYGRAMETVARPVDGEPLRVLRDLAREHGCAVGGGFLSVRGDESRGTYALCEADGAVHLHDKDLPSFWENAYTRPGRDDGVARTGLGTLGLACGWEWGRTRTVDRLRGRVQLLAGGMHFISYPDWPLTRRWFRDRDQHLLVQYGRELPGRVARFLGVPAVYASHVGDLEIQTPLLRFLTWRAPMIGETQICDADGRPLARLSLADGEGYVCADVSLEENPVPRDDPPRTFWNSEFPVSAHLVWYGGNAYGKAEYALKSRLGRHRWSPSPDLPDHVPAGELVDHAPAG